MTMPLIRRDPNEHVTGRASGCGQRTRPEFSKIEKHSAMEGAASLQGVVVYQGI